MFNILALKNGMKSVGFVVSEGELMTARDMSEFYDWAQRFFGLTKIKAAYGLAYPSTVPKTMPGHPDNVDTPIRVDVPVEMPPPVAFQSPTPTPVIINDLAAPEPEIEEHLESVPGEIVEVTDESVA